MQLMKFGSFYIHLEKIAYVHKFTPDVLPASAVKARNVGRVRIGLVRGTKNFFRLPTMRRYRGWGTRRLTDTTIVFAILVETTSPTFSFL